MRFLIAISLAFTINLATPVDGTAFADRGRDNDRAREELKKEKILSYRDIKRRVKSRFDGKIVGQTLRERGGGRMIYDLSLKRKDGRVVRVIVDAHNGQILSTRGR